jgi:hypothetical protein
MAEENWRDEAPPCCRAETADDLEMATDASLSRFRRSVIFSSHCNASFASTNELTTCPEQPTDCDRFDEWVRPNLMTTLVQFITAAAILLSSDSMLVDSAGNDRGRVAKIVSLSKNLAVASCDLASIDATVRDNRSSSFPIARTFRYDFTSWVAQFANATDPLQLTALLAQQARKTFADYGLLISARAFQPRSLLAEFYVAGYTAESMPIINKIAVPLDWSNAKVLDPQVEQSSPAPGDLKTWWFNAACKHDAIAKITQRAGEPYLRIREREPELTEKLLGGRNLTTEEAKQLSVSLITIESEFSPSQVGLPVQTVELDKHIVKTK